ncbi:hypothetical protein ACFL6E_04710 [Candidatus Neomarinimicrobiota bacterium]
MKRFLKHSLATALISCVPLWGQASLDVQFEDLVTFYVASVDVATGETNVALFAAEIIPTEGPVDIRITFSIAMEVEAFDLDFSENLLSMTTKPFTLQDRLVIRNTDLSSGGGLTLVDDGGNAVEIKMDNAEKEQMPTERLNDMQSIVMQTGRLPDGKYKITVGLLEPLGAVGNPFVERSYVIESSHPVSLELLSPGGPLADLEIVDPTTTDPNFQWASDPCNLCDYYIRVAKFNCEEHNSLEDAIDDQTVLPMEQSLGWHQVGSTTSFQWPTSGVIDLEPGNIYAWQVKKTIPTSTGDEEVTSEIFAYLVRSDQSNDPFKQFLEELLSDDLVEQYYTTCGPLMGYIGNESSVTVDGIPIDMLELDAIKQAIQEEKFKIRSVEVQ